MHTIRKNDQKILGLGCSTFGGSKSRKTALRSLSSAFHHGINYYDLARSYGYGQAESIVGEFIKGKRNKIILTSKFGIAPPKPFPLMEQVKDAVRFVKKIAPGISGKVINAYSVNNVKRPTITPRLVIDSLERSLSELGTDYLDYFLIHDCPYNEAANEDVCFALEKAKEKGMILKWGATCESEQELEKYFQKSSPFQTVQFPYHPQSQYVQNIDIDRQRVIFSVMRQSATGASPSKSFFDQLQINQIEPGLIANLQEAWLYIASRELNNGVVLCSMTNESHIKRNAAILKGKSLSKEELVEMKQVVQQAMQPVSSALTIRGLQPSPLY